MLASRIAHRCPHAFHKDLKGKGDDIHLNSRRSAHSAGPSRDLAVAGLFVSFSPFSVLVFTKRLRGCWFCGLGEGLCGYVRRVLGFQVGLRTLWKRFFGLIPCDLPCVASV